MALETPPVPEPARGLEDYVDQFRDVFRRRDQRRWAAVYLQGLLTPGGRKNVEGISDRVTPPDGWAAGNLSQSLQNFLNHSPWDEQAVWRRWRELAARPLLTSDSTLVLVDLIIAKQGRHSVGVQRQHVATLGRKINCQVAVSVHLAGSGGTCPLALRLYLPRGWCRQTERLEAAGVPEEYRPFATRTELALRMLDSLRHEGFGGLNIVVGHEYGEEWAAESPRRGWTTVVDNAKLDTVRAGCRRLNDELGLDHFEGRSWRGFHHHACLVALASSARGSGFPS
jgi:SRSO17 transposase